MVSVGSLNLPEALLNSELKIMILEAVVAQLIENQERLGRKPNIDIESIRSDALERLREKYPDLNIESEYGEKR